MNEKYKSCGSMAFLILLLFLLYPIYTFAAYTEECGYGIYPKESAVKGCKCDLGYTLDKNGKCRTCDTNNGYGMKGPSEPDVCVKCVDLNKILHANTCGCKKGYSGDSCLQCAENFEEWPAASGTCYEKCAAEYERDAQGNCVEKCDAEHVRDAQGVCIEICKEGEKTDGEGKCVAECPYANTKKSAEGGACICITGFASYNGKNDVPCVECGPNSAGIDGGECKCENSFHVSMDGSCVPNSSDCKGDDPNAVLSKDGEKCECKAQFGYTVDPDDTTHKPYCKFIPCTVNGENYYEPEGACLSPDAIACIEKGDEWKAGQCEVAKATGDCNCNFTGGEPTVAQALIPFIAIVFGTGGLLAWRRKKRCP